MSYSTMFTVACLTCSRLQRDCDRKRPVCSPCLAAENVICSWKATESCLTCATRHSARLNRACIGGPPVCQTCRYARDTYCSWLVAPPPRSNEASPGDNDPNGGPGPDERLRTTDQSRTAASVNILRRLSQTAPEVDIFLANERCRRLLDADQELQELFAQIGQDKNAAEYSAAQAILALSLGDGSSQWGVAAIEGYSTAVSILRSHLQSIEAEGKQNDLAVAVALANKFELLNPFGGNPGYMHLVALRDFCRNIPPSVTGISEANCTLIKILIYYTAIGSTFSFSKAAKGLPASYIYDLRNQLSNAASHNSSQQDSFQGIPYHYYSIIFQVALARHESTPTGPGAEDAKHLEKLKQQLLDERGDYQRPEVVHRIQLFNTACLIFLTKVLEPSCTARDVRAYFQDIPPDITEIDWSRQPLSVVWPLLIMYLAGDRQHRRDIRAALQNIRLCFGLAALNSTIAFLDSIEQLHDQTGESPMFNYLLIGDVPSITLY